jgi:hypothetical protein
VKTKTQPTPKQNREVKQIINLFYCRQLFLKQIIIFHLINICALIRIRPQRNTSQFWFFFLLQSKKLIKAKIERKKSKTKQKPLAT